uniref:Enoyl-CoA hydratase domain-containing protein 3, mitochondrial n=1 Tax=Panagrellus redivivus TaxID=6233 RepID=A0A7E4V6J0_PANRE
MHPFNLFALVSIFSITVKYSCVTDEEHADNNLCNTYHQCWKKDASLCDYVALLAVFKDGKFYAKGFGVVVGAIDVKPRYLLTTMSSSIPKYHDKEEWVALYGNSGYQLMARGKPPKVSTSPFNLNTWQDLALFELINDGDFAVGLVIQADLTAANGKDIATVITPTDGKGTRHGYAIRPGEVNECTKAFESEQPHYNPEYMECVKDEFHTLGNKQSADYSYGSIVAKYSGKTPHIVGLKSVYGPGPDNKYFIIVKLAKHCQWLEDVSKVSLYLDPSTEHLPSSQMHPFNLFALVSIFSITVSVDYKVQYDVNGKILGYSCVTDEVHADNNLCNTYYQCFTNNFIHCKHVALLAVFADGKFYAKGFGVVVGSEGNKPRHILTTMSSSIPKYHNKEHWVALHGNHGYQLMGPDKRPNVKTSPFNLNTWQDLALYQLVNDGDFPSFITIKTDLTTVNGNDITTVITPTDGKGIRFGAQIRPGEVNECTQAMSKEQPYYNPEYMECIKDEFHSLGNKQSADYSYGSIVAKYSDKTSYIVGLKSVYGPGPDNNYFIVVKLAKHCQWLEDVSKVSILFPSICRFTMLSRNFLRSIGFISRRWASTEATVPPTTPSEPGENDLFERELYLGNKVVRLVLNAPKIRNSLSLELIQALQKELSGIDKVQKVRAVIIAGKGPAFSAGHDLKQLTTATGSDYHRQIFAECTKLLSFIQQMQVPVIAEVDGVAAAAGCQLVASCDVVVASPKSTFSVPGQRVGLFCSTPGVALVRNIPRKLALDMLLTGRAINAQEALQAGLISRISPEGEEPRFEALKVAESILDYSRSVTALGKLFFYTQTEVSQRDAYRYGESVMVENLKMADAQEGIQSFIGKRAPEFQQGVDKVHE